MDSRDDDGVIAPARKVGYTWSKEYEEVCNYLPSNIGRVSLPPKSSLILSHHEFILSFEHMNSINS
jgi:hypothetical protein